MGKNKEDCKTLISNITKLFETVHHKLGMVNSLDQVAIDSYSKTWSQFEKYVDVCIREPTYLMTDFVRSLRDAQTQLISISNEKRFRTNYTRADKIRQMIVAYEKEVERLKSDLLVCLLSSYCFIASHYWYS